MQLTLHQPGEYLFIHSCLDQGPEDKQGITVVDRLYRSSLILDPQNLMAPWPVTHIDDITEQHLEQLLQLQPEVVLIGCGCKQRFLTPRLQHLMLARGIGCEVMITAAACRTFNIMVGENRRVAAALIVDWLED